MPASAGAGCGAAGLFTGIADAAVGAVCGAIAPSGVGGVEAAVEGDWARWLGDSGEFVGMTGFGASAPAETLYREFGITAEAVVTAARRCIAQSRTVATDA